MVTQLSLFRISIDSWSISEAKVHRIFVPTIHCDVHPVCKGFIRKVDSVLSGWFAPVETWAGASWGFFIGLYPLFAIFALNNSGTECFILFSSQMKTYWKVCVVAISYCLVSDRFGREICISKREICSGIKHLKDTFSRFQNPFHRTCAGSSYKFVDRISFNANIFWFDLTWWIMDRYSGQKNCRDLCGPRNI